MEKEGRLQKQKDFLIKFTYWAVWGVSGVLLVKFVGPVLFPFIAAFLVAWLLSHPVEFIAGKTHLKRNLVAVTAVLFFYALIAVGLYFAVSGLTGFVQDIFQELTHFLSDTVFPMLERFFRWLEHVTQSVNPAGNTVKELGQGSTDVIEKTGKVVSEVSGNVLGKVSGVAACIPGICMKVLIAVISTVFMELEFPSILEFLKAQVPEKWQKRVLRGKAEIMGTMGKCFLSYALLMLMTFGELFLGFLLLGIEGAFAIALIIAVLDILPVLGTGTILIPWTVICFATGDLRLGIGLLAVYLIITVVRNIIEPKLVGRQMGLSPVVMLPCMLIGLQFFGLIGLIGLPFFVSFLKNLNEKGIIHIFKNKSEKGSEDEV